MRARPPRMRAVHSPASAASPGAATLPPSEKGPTVVNTIQWSPFDPEPADRGFGLS